MKILFITATYPHETVGGIESVTHTLAKEFTSDGHECYVAYMYKALVEEKDLYKDSIHFCDVNELSTLVEFVQRYNINLIINQQGFADFVRNLKLQVGNRCKLISCIHTLPTRFVKFTFKELINSNKRDFKFCIKVFFYPFYYIFFRRKIERQMQALCEFSDAVVFLSFKFIDEFIKVFKIKSIFSAKITAIPNICKFQEAESCSYDEILQSKNKSILVLSRLTEYPKRISHSIKAWERYLKRNPDTDWTLHIVGHGPDLLNYMRYVNRYSIRNITFEGRKDSLPYFKNASVLLMTSFFEGFGMTLTEAQFMGCIPLCYDSSSAFHDIIDNERTGLIVRNGDINILSRSIEYLISNEKLRQEMISNMINDKYRFSRKTIVYQWYNLFKTLTNEQN